MKATVRASLTLLYFTFPLMNVGLIIGDYPFSLPMIFLLIAVACITLGVMKGTFLLREYVLLSALLFWGYIFPITLSRSQLDTGIISLLLLLCLMVPFSVVFPTPGLQAHCQKWFLRGQYLNWGICLTELLLQVTGAHSLESLLPLMVPQRTTPIVSGLSRITGLMIEPSFLAIYLVFGYIVNEQLVQKPHRRNIARVIFMGLLLLTGSLSGLFLWLLYLGLVFMRKLGEIARSGRIQKRTLVWVMRWLLVVVVLLLFVFIGGKSSGTLFSTFLEYLVYRWERIILYLRTGDFQSSEGFRLSAIGIALKYLREGSFFGEGYSRVEQWLTANTWLTNGKIHNIYAYLLIAFGFPGFFLFLIYILVIVWRSGKCNLQALIVWGMAGFATGHVILYYLWGYLLLFTLTEQRFRSQMDSSSPATSFPRREN